MTHAADGSPGETADGAAPLPDLFLYTRDGCHLCDEAREILTAVLAERATNGRPVPGIIERDITTNNTWLREFFATIPVVELAGRRVELATSASKLRRLLEEALDEPGADVVHAAHGTPA